MTQNNSIELDTEILAAKYREALGKEIDQRIKAETLIDMLAAQLKEARDALDSNV